MTELKVSPKGGPLDADVQLEDICVTCIERTYV